MGPPPKGAFWMAESLARMARVLWQSLLMELPAAAGQGLGTWILNEPIGRTKAPPARRAVRGRSGLPISHDAKFTGRGERLRQRQQRQPTSSAGWVVAFVFHAIAVS